MKASARKAAACSAQDAECEYAGSIGEAVGFAFSEVEGAETEEDRMHDELMDLLEQAGVPRDAARRAAVKLGPWVQSRTRSEDAVDRVLFAETLKCILGHVEAAPKPRLEAACTRMAIGWRESNGDSMRRVAAHCGVTVEAISKRVAEIRSTHRLAINSFNKSEAAAATYSLTNTTRKST